MVRNGRTEAKETCRLCRMHGIIIWFERRVVQDGRQTLSGETAFDLLSVGQISTLTSFLDKKFVAT